MPRSKGGIGRYYPLHVALNLHLSNPKPMLSVFITYLELLDIVEVQWFHVTGCGVLGRTLSFLKKKLKYRKLLEWLHHFAEEDK